MTNARRLPEKMEPATLHRSVLSLEGRHLEPVLVGSESAVYSRYMLKQWVRSLLCTPGTWLNNGFGVCCMYTPGKCLNNGFGVCCVLQVYG